MPWLQRDPLLLAPLIAGLDSPECGAVATFAGMVRNHHAGRAVVSLTYTAYEPMAEALCGQIVSEAEVQFAVRAALVHRLGDVPIGEAAVLVVASGAHRAEAFNAVRWIVDEVKSRVPIWKRERYADGSEVWVDPTAATGTVPAKASS